MTQTWILSNIYTKEMDAENSRSREKRTATGVLFSKQESVNLASVCRCVTSHKSLISRSQQTEGTMHGRSGEDGTKNIVTKMDVSSAWRITGCREGQSTRSSFREETRLFESPLKRASCSCFAPFLPTLVCPCRHLLPDFLPYARISAFSPHAPPEVPEAPGRPPHKAFIGWARLGWGPETPVSFAPERPSPTEPPPLSVDPPVP